MEKQFSRLVEYPFRIFFLSAAVWAVLVIPLWVAAITGSINLPTALPLLEWHRHEMLFGFLNPAVAGFLLTAVCVWTGTDRLRGVALFTLWLVWLCGRLVMLIDLGQPDWLVIAINLAFLPLVMLDAGLRIWKVKQTRQYLLLAILFLLWGAEAGLLCYPQGNFAAGAMLAIILLMTIIGGRITPGFSAGWLRSNDRAADAIYTSARLDAMVLVSTLTLLIFVFLPWPNVVIALALLAGALHLIRVLLWRGWLVRSEPLLWVLHLAQLWMPVALVLMALGMLGWLPVMLWLHAGGIGAIATLILGVMARVSLGHTGRSLILPSGMALAFILLQVSALLRLATGGELIDWKLGISISALLWVGAFALFLIRYTPVLMTPRVDGKPG